MSTRHLPSLRAATAVALAVFAVGVTACGGDDESDAAATDAAATDAAASGEPVIEIASFAFSGPTSVPSGTVLTVVNNDSAPHTFTADDGSFDSGTIEPGDTFEITLSAAGTVAFHCDFHSGMTGSITVT